MKTSFWSREGVEKTSLPVKVENPYGTEQL